MIRLGKGDLPRGWWLGHWHADRSRPPSLLPSLLPSFLPSFLPWFCRSYRGSIVLPPYITQRFRLMRVLGIDFGLKRVGLALSDPSGTIASPLPTLKRRAGKRPPLKAIAELVEEHQVGAVVMGLPLALSGEDSEWTLAVREVAEALAERTGLPVHMVDERFTSVRAERAIRSLGLPKHKREQKERIDAASAVLILQAWLDMESLKQKGAQP